MTSPSDGANTSLMDIFYLLQELITFLIADLGHTITPYTRIQRQMWVSGYLPNLPIVFGNFHQETI